MSWFIDLLSNTETPVQSIFVLCLAGIVGLSIGRIRYRGVSIGIAGILFGGLLLGHLGLKLNPSVLFFTRDFGLVLFVYSVGLQVGPGFFSSLKKHGMELNLMAATIVISGGLIAVILVKIVGIELPAAIGILSGATTNTPSLAAAQEALGGVPTFKSNPELLKLTTIGYAVAYPGAIIGVISSMIFLRWLSKKYSARTPSDRFHEVNGGKAGLNTVNLEVMNSNLDGLPLKKVPELETGRIAISHILHKETVVVATPETIIRFGDVIHAVGSKEDLERLRLVIGRISSVDVPKLTTNVTSKKILVTKTTEVGKTIGQLGLQKNFDVVVTRVTRSEIEFTANDSCRIQLGDELRVVGSPEALNKVSATLGNSLKELIKPHLIPVFLGISLGIIVGSIPFSFQNLPSSIKLGIAGGPLLIAIMFGYLSNKGYRFGFMPLSANLMLRELGIILFLATVGIHSGSVFVDTLIHGHGLYWMFCGLFITLLPILLVGTFACKFRKIPPPELFGLLAGSMTNPPALAFGNSMSGNDAPSVFYATVYPLVMLLRIVFIQLLSQLLLS